MAVDRVGIAQADALAGHLSSLPGLPIYETSLPTVETVGYLLPSREAGLECRGLGSVVSCR